jgi:hypothetical protein
MYIEEQTTKNAKRKSKTSDIRRVNLVTHPVISREWGKNREVFTTLVSSNSSCELQKIVSALIIVEG